MFKSKELMFPRDKWYFIDTSWIFFQNYFLSTSFLWGRGSFLLIVFLCFCVLNGEIRFKWKITLFISLRFKTAYLRFMLVVSLYKKKPIRLMMSINDNVH